MGRPCIIPPRKQGKVASRGGEGQNYLRCPVDSPLQDLESLGGIQASYTLDLSLPPSGLQPILGQDLAEVDAYDHMFYVIPT